MKKYLMAFILGFAVLMTVSSCEDSMSEITLENTGKEKVKQPE